MASVLESNTAATGARAASASLRAFALLVTKSFTILASATAWASASVALATNAFSQGVGTAFALAAPRRPAMRICLFMGCVGSDKF